MSKTTVKILNTEKFLTEEFKIIKDLGEKEVEEIAKEVEKRIQFNILASIQRPGSTGNLAKSFFASKIPNGWGIGDIAYLNQHAPYWQWINYGRAKSGRTVPPATKGYFNPGVPYPDGSAFRQGKWQTTTQAFLMVPTRPIQAHNFIARTLQSLNPIIAFVLSRRRKI